MKLSRLQVGLGITGLTNALCILIGIVTGVITARGLGPAHRGELVAIMVWSGLLSTLALLGQDEALIHRVRGRSDQAKSLMSVLLESSRLRLATLMIALAALIFLVAPSVRQAPIQSFVVAMSACLIIPLNSQTLLGMAVLRVHERLGVWNALRLLPQVAYLLGLLLLLVSDNLTVESATAALATGSLVTGLLTWVAIARTPEAESPSTILVAKTRAYGRQLLVASAPSLLLQRIDLLLLGIIGGPVVLGIYSVAVSVAGVLLVLGSTIEQVVFPKFAAVLPPENVVWKYFRLAIVSSVVPSVLLWISAVPLIGFVYGQEYKGAGSPLVFLLLAATLRNGGSVLRAWAKAAGFPQGLTASSLVGLALTGLSMWPAVREWGGQGAALAGLLGALAEVAVLCVLVRRRLALDLEVSR